MTKPNPIVSTMRTIWEATALQKRKAYGDVLGVLGDRDQREKQDDEKDNELRFQRIPPLEVGTNTRQGRRIR